MTEGQPAAECWLGGTVPVAFQADTPRGVRSVPRPAGIDGGASPIGAQSSSSARYGRTRYRAELELRAPGGKAPTLGIPTSPRGSYGALTFDCEWASGRSATPARLAPQRPRSRSVGPTSTTGRAPASDKSRS